MIRYLYRIIDYFALNVRLFYMATRKTFHLVTDDNSSVIALHTAFFFPYDIQLHHPSVDALHSMTEKFFHRMLFGHRITAVDALHSMI